MEMNSRRPAPPKSRSRVALCGSVACAVSTVFVGTTASAQTTSATTSTTTTAARGAAQLVPSTLTVPPTPTSSVAATSSPAVNVSTPTTTPTSTTIPSPITVTVSQEVANGFTVANQPLGPQRTLITVVNQGTSILFNQQMVVKLGAKPDILYFTKDSSGSVGVIDGPSGVWFHTIAQLNPNTAVVYTVTWNKACPGRWPLGVRVGETISWQVYQWVSPSVGTGCPLDDTAKPEPQVLPWPASFPTPPVIAPVAVSTTSTTTPAGSGGSGASGSAGSTGSATTKPGVTAPAVGAVPATVSPSSRPTATILYCRTVKGKRVCGPARPSAKPAKKISKTTKALKK
jgi:hypothetical protein